jgi:tetratricopeptide (TPR) repeat protein
MLFLLFCQHGFSQQKKVDSLLAALKASKHDTSKITILFTLVESIANDDEWAVYNEQAYELTEKLVQSKNESISKKGKKGLADALNNKGYLSKIKGDILKASEYYNKSLKIQEEIGDKRGMEASLNNIGSLFENQGDIPKALDYYGRSLKIAEELGDKRAMGYALSNMGGIYNGQGDMPRALDYHIRSLKVREEIGDKEGIAYSLINVGLSYYNQDDFPKALDYYMKGLKIREAIGDKKGIATLLHNIGAIYLKQKNIPEALDYFKKSLKMRKDAGDKHGITFSFNSLGSAYIAQVFLQPSEKQKMLPLAFAYADSSLVLSKELGFPKNIRNAEQLLSRIDSARGNFAAAFEHFKQFTIYRDSINNEGTRKASIKNQLKYEFEKKEAVIKEQQEKERVLAEEKDQRQQIIIWSVAFGLLLMILFAVFAIRSLKITRHQKEIIEEKQKDILDSIRYAKRIQKSLLPPDKFIDKTIKRLKDK